MHDGSEAVAPSDVYFVGVAASAGGLEAASLLVQNLPKDANAVYVLAQHMSPTHKSLLSSLISRETNLPVVELKGSVKPQKGTIYVTPPNSDVTLKEGKLCLTAPSGHAASPKPSADRLFKSLAQECGEHCVAIVLSGTGSDGSYGVQAVREAGGITIAQDISSAKYDGMPSSAVETGCIDLTLTPEQMGQHLEKILASPRDLASLKTINETPSRLSDLLKILLARTQIDFREYKENTINRRIARRMVALGIQDYDEYVDFCRQSQHEVDALYKDLLISVTRFFRDPKQFEQLKLIVEELVARRDNNQIRVWVAGCATGEEAYSIAMLFAEAMGGLETMRKSDIQIFASDIDDRALEVARRGVYPISAIHDIPKQFSEKYVEIHGNSLEISSPLRSVVLFSRHNIAQDPPFINVDLVSLRNVLIYFNTMLQERVLNRVHYALNSGGALFLGTSETVGAMQPYFETRNGADKMFSKRAITALENLSFDDARRSALVPSGTRQVASKPKNESATKLFDALARSVAPNGFIATPSHEIVRVFGEISGVLEINEQSPLSLSTRSLRRPLRDEVTAMVSASLKNREARTGRWHDLVQNPQEQVRIICYPIHNPDGGEDLVLFAVQKRETQEPVSNLEQLGTEDRVKYVRQIEAEMLSTREALQQTVEELQTTNEELQSVNEELQSTNEELQATNEELETSNEELQSTNEELITVNEEMQVNASELQKVTTELAAILENSPYSILIVDPALLVRRCSESAKTFFGFGDLPKRGLHISQCRLPEGFPSLAPLCSEALNLRESRVVPVETNDGVYSLYITPFFDAQDSTLGLELSIIDVDLSVAEVLTGALERMGELSHWRINIATNQVFWSDRVFEIHGLPKSSKAPTIEKALGFFHPDDRDRVTACVHDAISNRESFSFEARLIRADGTVIMVESAGYAVEDASGDATQLVGAFRDITDELKNEMLHQQLKSVQRNLGLGFFTFDAENDQVHMFDESTAIFDLDAPQDTLTFEAFCALFHDKDRPLVQAAFDKCRDANEPQEFTTRLHNVEESKCAVECQIIPQQRSHRLASGVYGYLRRVNK